MNYYGVDFLGFVGVGLGAYLLSRKTGNKRTALLVAALACIPWVLFGIMSGSIWTCIANLTFGAIYLKGWRDYGKDEQKR